MGKLLLELWEKEDGHLGHVDAMNREHGCYHKKNVKSSTNPCCTTALSVYRGCLHDNSYGSRSKTWHSHEKPLSERCEPV